MGSKFIEYLVLTVGLLVVGAAVFLMYFDEQGTAAKSINIIFSVGFILYILHSHLLSRNLNREISELNLNISNLKEEIGRLEKTLKERNQTINLQKEELNKLHQNLSQVRAQLEEKSKALEEASNHIAKLEQEKENLA